MTRRTSARPRSRQKKAASEAKAKEKPKAPGPSANGLGRLKTDQLEVRIEKLQSRIKEIDLEMGDPEVWRDARKANSLSGERKKIAEELEPLEFEWARRAEEEN